MRNLILIFFLCIYLNQVQAQNTVNISGEISNINSAELIYLGVEGQIFPLTISDVGDFSVDGSTLETPSFFYFANISKRGKIEQQTPLIWFETDNVEVKIDWSDKSFQMEDPMPFQSTSEKIEALKGTKQIKYILNNPVILPSLYFADKYKEKISIPELEAFSKEAHGEYKNTVYLKRIANYVAAKKYKTLKKGKKVEHFKLPNKDGQQVPVIDGTNKTTLIALFSSGCSFSVASIGLLEQLNELNNDKIKVVTIWEDPSREIWLNTHQDKKQNITWINLWDQYGFASTYLNMTMVPTFYVINEEGELAEIIKGYSQKTANRLRKLIE